MHSAALQRTLQLQRAIKPEGLPYSVSILHGIVLAGKDGDVRDKKTLEQAYEKALFHMPPGYGLVMGVDGTTQHVTLGFVARPLVVKADPASPLRSRLFASQAIPAMALIGEAQGSIRPRDASSRDPLLVHHFKLMPDGTLDFNWVLNVSDSGPAGYPTEARAVALAHHDPARPNTVYVNNVDRGTLELWSTKPIAAGEELLANRGVRLCRVGVAGLPQLCETLPLAILQRIGRATYPPRPLPPGMPKPPPRKSPPRKSPPPKAKSPNAAAAAVVATAAATVVNNRKRRRNEAAERHYRRRTRSMSKSPP